MQLDVMCSGGDLRGVQQLAREAAAAGISGLVFTESSRTAYLAATAAALATDGLDLSTGVAVAFPRSPMVTAQIAWELAAVSGGRFRLGLGTQIKIHTERRYGSLFDPPGPRLREYVLAVKAIFRAFRGDPVSVTTFPEGSGSVPRLGEVENRLTAALMICPVRASGWLILGPPM